MSRIVCIMIVIGLATLAAVATALARPALHGGDVTRLKADFELAADYRSAERLEVGEKIEGVVTLYRNTFFDRKVVSAQCEVKNPTDATIYISYHAALFDADGNLLGCTAMTTEIEAKDDTVLGVLIELPADRIDRVASYQVVLYESDHEIGG